MVQPTPSEQGGKHHPTIFIMGDHPGILEALEEAIPPQLVHIIVANDGLTALPVISQENPEFIFIDSMLPDLDGYHFCQIIRQSLQLDNSTIVILSIKGGLIETIRGRIAGATASVKMPPSIEELTQLIKKYLQDGGYLPKEKS